MWLTWSLKKIDLKNFIINTVMLGSTLSFWLQVDKYGNGVAYSIHTACRSLADSSSAFS